LFNIKNDRRNENFFLGDNILYNLGGYSI